MKVTFTPSAWNDYLWWQGHDSQPVKRIDTLIEDIRRNGYAGIGKPEPLSRNLSGYWSRRITSAHRIVYAVEDDSATIIACRYHYE
ncbi:Txe/YoeB family addiction module toxin [Nocardia callitridis]|uniref:Endoribonuclease YoeB n=1 Tax=Nocardia callitridis TaxID=648753 RepID=A0ABP9KPZ8_9NOCA